MAVGGGKMKRWILLMVLIIVVLLTPSCLKLNNTSKGKLLVSFTSLKAIPSSQVVRGTVEIKRNGRTLQKTFDLPVSQIEFNSIEEGLWNINVQLQDQDYHVIYVGSEQARVIADQTTYCSVTLSLNTADLLINVFVESDQPDTISVSLSCDGDIHTDQKSLQNGKAFFSFNDLRSAVWDMRLTLFDGQDEIMIVPETGAYGLELQPGRTNSFDVTVDKFGNLSVQVSVLGIDTVQNATLTNLEEGIQILWDPVKDASSYDLYRKEKDLWFKLNAVPIEGSSFLDTDVVEGEMYYYVINAKSSSGLQSGFSDPFMITRDTKRIFIGTYQDKTLYRMKMTSSGLEVAKQASLSGYPIHLHTKGNYLYAVANSSVIEFDSTDLQTIRSKSIGFVIEPCDFSGDYLFLLGANKIIRIDLRTLELNEYVISSVNFLSADRYLCTVADSRVQLRDVENPGNIIAETSGTYGFTEGDRLFVYDGNNLKVYSIDSNGLTYQNSLSLLETPKTVCIHQSGEYAYVAVDDGFYSINLSNMQNNKTGSLNLTKGLLVHENELFLIHDKYLKVYDLTNPMSPTLVFSHSFDSKIWVIFVD